MVAESFNIIMTLFKPLSWLWRNIKFVYSRLKSGKTIPRKTIVLVPEINQNRWSFGKKNDLPALHLNCRFYVTNLSNELVYVLVTYIKRPKVTGWVAVKRYDKEIFGNYPIPPQRTTELLGDYTIQPPIIESGDLLLDLVFVDQYDNRHKIKKVNFRGPSQKKETEIKYIEESIATIEDGIEKEVAGILKAEIFRYIHCGRRDGGLGSIETKYGKSNMVGVGSDSRTLYTAKNQSLVPDPENAHIISDNADALLNLYKNLHAIEDLEKFEISLLNRLNRKLEYARVAYMIFFVLFKIGKMKKALDTAKENLIGDPEYGFDDMLRLLDGLLKFKHNEFEVKDLDDIEIFLQGIDKYPKRILERVTSIRAFRHSV